MSSEGRVSSGYDDLVEQGWHVNCPRCGYLSVYFATREEALFVAEAHDRSGHNGPVPEEIAPARLSSDV